MAAVKLKGTLFSLRDLRNLQGKLYVRYRSGNGSVLCGTNSHIVTMISMRDTNLPGPPDSMMQMGEPGIFCDILT